MATHTVFRCAFATAAFVEGEREAIVAEASVT